MARLAVELGARVSCGVLGELWTRWQAVHGVEVGNVRAVEVNAAIEGGLATSIGTRCRLFVNVECSIIYWTLIHTIRIGEELRRQILVPLKLLHLLHEVVNRLALPQRLRHVRIGRRLDLRIALNRRLNSGREIVRSASHLPLLQSLLDPFHPIGPRVVFLRFCSFFWPHILRYVFWSVLLHLFDGFGVIRHRLMLGMALLCLV